MKNSIVLALASIAATTVFTSCGGSKKGTLDSGATYEFIVGKPSNTLKAGDVVEMNYNFKIGDSVLNSSAQAVAATGKPMEFTMPELDTANYFNTSPVPLDGLYKMNQGDSTIFTIAAKVFFEKIQQPSPEWIKETDTFFWEVKLEKVQSADAIAKEFAAKRKKEDNFLKTASGLEYKFTEISKEERLTKFGDIMEFNLVQSIGDSVMFDSKEQQQGKPLSQPISKSTQDFDLMEGLAMMRSGDKAIFRVPISELLAKGMPKQDWMKDTDYLQFDVEVVGVKSAKEIKEEAEKKEKEALANDDKAIQDYLKAANITNFKKTESGLYYVIHQEGTGEPAKKGQEVTVDYTGKLIDGTVFDSNTDPKFNHVEDFTVAIGQGRVIKGWDEGLALFNKGTKATLYIPSALGYGANGAGASIPANAILIFDIVIKDIK